VISLLKYSLRKLLRAPLGALRILPVAVYPQVRACNYRKGYRTLIGLRDQVIVGFAESARPSDRDRRDQVIVDKVIRTKGL
jgi:hypothetical protein